ncbi:hypothetical protein GCM10025867_50860 (plasmid) [Frondihabitans sucicola]|uniref:PH domain-containing protein n=1 Tax=Frondihabitans sucicola TaxID=1268041 RepID=A0ABM8GWI3_9MICO|nr:hypothetical protein [Frondihabitans sucicola]BDZ52845.1 hypothetical protein GCM10025867_50860 [Frondihabitans sucicola]
MTNTNAAPCRNEAAFETTGANGWTTVYEVLEEDGRFTVTTEDHEDGVDFHTTRQFWTREELQGWVDQLQRVLARSA